jgi:3-dehydroquinate synthase
VRQDDFFEINSLAYPVFIGSKLWIRLREFVQPYLKPGGIFIFADQNTLKFCLPLLVENIPELGDHLSYAVMPGEESKDISGLEEVWNWLMKSGATRESLLVNLGGGVVSDLGGFAAATFHRGMPYINIPTSLIGQVDAAIGGKTGINVAGVKNQAGIFYDPLAVFIFPGFLATLPENHFMSGFAEIIKSALLAGKNSLHMLKANLNPGDESIFGHILETVKFKCDIVAKDPHDRSVRKILNFGHTIGHAFESLFNQNDMPGMLHGEAVAAGMICEALISSEINGLSKWEQNEIASLITKYFEIKPLEKKYFDNLMELLAHDKKRNSDRFKFTLLESPGKPCIDCSVGSESIIRALRSYNQIIEE